MKKLLSLPPNLVQRFHRLEQVCEDEWFCTADPPGCKLGSGGGTTWLLEECFRSERGGNNFFEWLSSKKRILLHAGGQSRRLPAYAPSGKVLTPIPVFRWARGQRLEQNLLSLQMPLYEKPRCHLFPRPMWCASAYGWTRDWLKIMVFSCRRVRSREHLILCCRNLR